MKRQSKAIRNQFCKENVSEDFDSARFIHKKDFTSNGTIGIGSTIPTGFAVNTQNTQSTEIYLEFLNKLEGWKTKCKNLHWAAPKMNLHQELDKFYKVLDSFQDVFAETYQGILNPMGPDDVEPLRCHALNAHDLVVEVENGTAELLESLPEVTLYAGLKSETETFLKNVQTYKYLFRMCI